MPTPTKKKYLSQLAYRGANADTKPLKTTASDEAVFALLKTRHSDLPAEHIWDMLTNKEGLSDKQLKEDLDRFKRRLARLARERNGEEPYLDRYKKDNHRDSVYSLNPHRFKIKRRNEPLFHAIIANIVAASLVKGAEESGAKVHLWEDLIRDGWSENGLPQSIPIKTLRTSNPFKFELPDEHELVCDWPVFAAEIGDQYQFAVSEIDRDTEDGFAPDKKKTNTIEWKFKKYRQIVNGMRYRQNMNFPNFMVFWFTVSEARKRFLMNVLREVLHEPNCDCDLKSDKGRQQHAKALAAIACKYHAFTTVDDWGANKDIKYPSRDGSYFTRVYPRVGCKPYSLLTLGDTESE